MKMNKVFHAYVSIAVFVNFTSVWYRSVPAIDIYVLQGSVYTR